MTWLTKLKQLFKKQPDSQEPWVEWHSDSYDPQLGICMKLDWNDAFIVHLRQNGFTGTDDEAIVQHWLASVAQQQAERMKEENAYK